MNSLIGGPNHQSSAATAKNRMPRPNTEAIPKVQRSSPVTPLAIVITL